MKLIVILCHPVPGKPRGQDGLQLRAAKSKVQSKVARATGWYHGLDRDWVALLWACASGRSWRS